MYWKNIIKLFIRKSNVDSPFYKENYELKKIGNFVLENTLDKVPHIIWTYWHEKQVNSAITQLCLERIKKINPKYDFRLVNKGTLKKWLPDFPFIKSDLPLANISDLVRLMLLEKYGGIYLDASILLFQPLDWLLAIQINESVDTVAYYSKCNTVNEKYPMIETWCIAAVPQAPFIQCWLDEYKKCILSNSPDSFYASDTIVPSKEAVLGYEYYKCYYSAQIVIRRDQAKFRLGLVEADHDAFLYSLQVPNQWSDLHFANILMINKYPKKLPRMAKIINTSRKRIDDWIKEGYWKRDSIYGSLINEYIL